jgi:16S rRNA (uracil1498-N3)-methyltransferase
MGYGNGYGYGYGKRRERRDHATMSWMRTPRVSVAGPVRPGELVDVSAEEGFHLASVLRRAPGDPVILVPESGGAFEGVIARIDGAGKAARVTVRALEAEAARAPPVVPWAAAVALARGDAFDLAVRMAAELGLEAVIPLFTERTVVRAGSAAREERWRRIAREAAKQCGREAPMAVLRARSLEELLHAWRAGRSLAGDFPGGPPRRGWVAVPGAPLRREDLLGAAGSRPPPAVFLIGPEGGLSPGEVARATAAGFETMGFPTPVLRTPTAVALLGALGTLSHGSLSP